MRAISSDLLPCAFSCLVSSDRIPFCFRFRSGTDDQNFVDFVGWLLKVKPEERPTAQEAMDHPWLTQSVYDWPE